MIIERPLSVRLTVSLGSLALLVLSIVASIYSAMSQHVSAITAVFLAVLGVALFGYFAYWGVAPTRLEADEHQVRFYPSIGKAQTFSRALVAAMVLVPAAKASSTVEFRANDGAVLFATNTLFGRTGFERFADYLHVPLQWKE